MSLKQRSAVPNPNGMSLTAAAGTFRKLKYVMKIEDESFGNLFGLGGFP